MILGRTIVLHVIWFLIFAGFVIFDIDEPKEKKVFQITLGLLAATLLGIFLVQDKWLIDLQGYGRVLTTDFAIITGFILSVGTSDKFPKMFGTFLVVSLLICVAYAWYFSMWWTLFFIVFALLGSFFLEGVARGIVRILHIDK